MAECFVNKYYRWKYWFFRFLGIYKPVEWAPRDTSKYFRFMAIGTEDLSIAMNIVYMEVSPLVAISKKLKETSMELYWSTNG